MVKGAVLIAILDNPRLFVIPRAERLYDVRQIVAGTGKQTARRRGSCFEGVNWDERLMRYQQLARYLHVDG